MQIENYLKHLIELKFGSVNAFSKEIDLAYTTVRSILERGVMNSKVENVLKICKGLGIKPESLMECETSNITDLLTITIQLEAARQSNVLSYANHQLMLQNETQNKVISLSTYKNDTKYEVNVHGYASAGTGETLADEVLFTKEIKGYIPPHDIALQVNGDSMEPMFEDKEIIFVEKTQDINSGQIGIFIIDGESYVKKVFIEEKRIRLVSLNSKYEDLYFYNNESIELIGKVIL